MDPYINPDSQTERTLQAMITRLEDRGKHPTFVGMIRRYAESLPTDAPLRVLDLGCGTGVVTRLLAGHLHPDSELHGGDVSAALLEEAKRRAVNARIQWDHLPLGKTTYPDGYFDVVVMHTLVSHVPEPLSLLTEAGRILKPGGRLILFDADHAGTTYGQPSYEQMRRTDFLLTTAIACNPDICRQMPRLLKAAGFELDSHHAEILSECGHGDYWLSSVRGFIGILPALKVLTEEEAAAWASHMLTSHENGTFFASGAFFTFYARKAG